MERIVASEWTREKMEESVAGSSKLVEGHSDLDCLRRAIEGNQILVHTPTRITDRLKQRRIDLWVSCSENDGTSSFQIVTSVQTSAAEIGDFPTIAGCRDEKRWCARGIRHRSFRHLSYARR